MYDYRSPKRAQTNQPQVAGTPQKNKLLQLLKQQ